MFSDHAFPNDCKKKELCGVGIVIIPDKEKLSSNLAVLAEIFQEMEEISREGHRCWLMILVEFKYKCKNS